MNIPLLSQASWLTGKILPRITIDDCEQMVAKGMLYEGAPIELLNGMLVLKDRRDGCGSRLEVGVRHANCITRLFSLLNRLCDGHDCHASSQRPIVLSKFDVPEPDLSIIRSDIRDYSDRHPVSNDTLLAIEVAHSSLEFDRGDKLHLYAAAGVSEYWIVNLLDDQVEVYRQLKADGSGYQSRMDCRAGDIVSLTLPDATTISMDVIRLIPGL